MRFALFCKSFGPDIERFARLLSSIERHDRAHIPFVVSVPRPDKALFVNRFGSDRIQFVTDEEVLGRDVKQSWRTQQLVKLLAWRMNFADAWFLVDSDYYFIRDFGVEDFVRGESAALFASLFSHILDDHEPVIREYLNGEGPRATPSREECSVWRSAAPVGTLPPLTRLLDRVRKPPVDHMLSRVQHLFQRQGPELHFLPGPLWTRDSLESMHRDWLEPNRLSVEDLIRFAPWEAVWVGEWEFHRGLPNRHLLPLPLLHVRSDDAIRRARATGLTEAKVAQRYLGIQLAARHQELLQLDP